MIFDHFFNVFGNIMKSLIILDKSSSYNEFYKLSKKNDVLRIMHIKIIPVICLMLQKLPNENIPVIQPNFLFQLNLVFYNCIFNIYIHRERILSSLIENSLNLHFGSVMANQLRILQHFIVSLDIHAKIIRVIGIAISSVQVFN